MIKNENFNTPVNKLRILIAPLDWGLGHATRCIPVILNLIKLDCVVIVGAEGAAKELLKQELPDLKFVDLRGYRMKYSRKKIWLPLKLLLQFPKLIFRVYAENLWLKKAVRQHNIDAVITDNRLGMYHAEIPSVYITHQLLIKTGNRLIEKVAQKLHYHFINKFTVCWVPDYAGDQNLAGELSHPVNFPKATIQYIGPLSRFEKNEEAVIKYDLCVIISGPEPQRSIFEKIILKELENYTNRIILIRGLPLKTLIPKINNPLVEIKNHLPTAELGRIIQQSKLIISRSGYSTVMDLVKLQKKAILVPTPGQTEQEYLADYLQKRKLFFCVDQDKFSLQEAVKNAELFSFNTLSITKNDPGDVIKKFVSGLINNAGI